MPTWCSEFPNDNPALHDGAVWVSMTTTGRPRAVARPARFEARKPPPAPMVETPDAFGQLVGLLCKVALSSGATRAAAVLPAFLDGETVELGDSSELVKRGHACAVTGGVALSESAAKSANAWRAVLNGQSDDLSACEDTLDTWCAELVAALAGAPARSGELRRELRRFGVAAFGLLAAA